MTKNRKRGMVGEELETWIENQHHVDENGCWIWNLTCTQGYGTTRVNKKNVGVHQHMLERKLGRKLLEGEVTRHICPNAPNRRCYNPQHLDIGTYKDNSHDAVSAGRNSKGEQHAVLSKCNVLTRDQVLVIKAARGIKTCTSLAEEYGVSAAQISRIQLGQRWKYVTN